MASKPSHIHQNPKTAAMLSPRPAALLLLLLAAAAMLSGPASAGGSPIHEAAGAMSLYTVGESEAGGMTCVGSSCYYDESEDMDVSGNHRQLLARRRRYLSYDMLKKNQVPCNRRGVSYYNCHRRGRANPYRRGCSYITRCARDLR